MSAATGGGDPDDPEDNDPEDTEPEDDEPRLDPSLGEPDLGSRAREYPVHGPIELDLQLAAGRVELRCGANDTARVQVRRLAAGEPAEGLSGLLNWVGTQLGDYTGEVAAVHDAEIDYADGCLRVHACPQLPQRLVPLHVLVWAPENSTLRARTGAATLAVSGRIGEADVRAGSGSVNLEAVTRPTSVQGGTGRVRLGAVEADARVRTGAGAVAVERVRDALTVSTGGGDVTVGRVDDGTCAARSGTGDLTVRAARAGVVELDTGSGQVRVGLPAGVLAALDLRADAGRLRSDVPVSDEPPADAAEDEARVLIRAHTGTGALTLVTAGDPVEN